MAAESGRQMVQGIIAKLNENPEMEESCKPEIQALDKFVVKYKNAYDFSTPTLDSMGGAKEGNSLRRPGTQDNVFVQLFQMVLELRFLESRWKDLESGNHRLVVLQVIRLFMRDKAFQRRFLLRGGRDELCSIFDSEGGKHYRHLAQTDSVGLQILTQIASMLTKLDADVLVHCRKTACYLLSTSDPHLLQCVLVIMDRLCQSNVVLSQQCQGLLKLPAGDGAVESGEKLLQILESQKNTTFRHLVADTLINACTLDEENRAIVVANEGIRMLLNLVHQSQSERGKSEGEREKRPGTHGGFEDSLLVKILHLLEIHAGDADTARLVRTLGGINFILNMLKSRADEPQPSKRRSSTDAGAPAGNHAVLEAGCLLLTRLAFDDENSMHIRQLNGVFVLAKLLLHNCEECSIPGSAQIVAAHALQALRLIFSLERNRKSFKRIFPPALFEKFIEIGQYQYEKEVAKYMPLAALIANLDTDKRDQIDKAIREMTDPKAGQRMIRDYSILGEPIGKGGFGTCYRVRREGGMMREGGNTYYALKEIRLEFGATEDTEQETHREVQLLQQMDHPNIVKYEESFAEHYSEKEGGGLMSLIIVMELVEGSSIKELIESKREKGEMIAEKQIREIMLQICHALYYIHKKKNITHRDLTPANILLSSEMDALTSEMILRPILVDFGLARQRKNDTSVMASVIGTLTYSCPELIERKPYTDKADVWSLGVIVYEMVCLTNPFTDTNPLQTARRIVEGDFKPIEDQNNNYSESLKKLIGQMMTPNTKNRPDIVDVMTATSVWDRVDRTTERDVMERTDELYIRVKELEEKAKRLQAEKQRLEMKMRGQHGSMWPMRTGTVLMPPNTPGFYGPQTPGPLTPSGNPVSPVRRNYLPTTPGAAMPNTPGSTAQRHFAQTPGGPRRPSRGPSLRVPANSVKEIDPAGQMLNQLHKIVFVTQLPPDMEEKNAVWRRAVEKYKRALFSPAGGKSLKQELQKLLSYSEELIDVNFFHENSRGDASSPDGKNKGQVTYEKMCRMIETLLKHNNYYDQRDEPSADPNEEQSADMP